MANLAKIIRPPEYGEAKGALIFLIGPIQGAPDWQSGAIEYLRHIPGLTIASPRRIDAPNPFTDKDFYEQIDWEHFYIEKALKKKNGVLFCWFAKEEKRRLSIGEKVLLAQQIKNGLYVPSRAYGQTSRFEIGVLAAFSHSRNARIVAGIEPGFSGERYLRYTLKKKFPRIHLCDSFGETRKKAVELLHKK